MRAKLVLSNKIKREITNFLFSNNQSGEKAGFVVCGTGRSKNLSVLVSKEFIPLKPSDFITQHDVGIQVSPSKIIRLINKSYPRGYCLVEVHSHPWTGEAFFSNIDKSGVKELVNYLFPQFPQMPYGAMVFTKDAFAAKVWFEKKQIVTEVKIFGKIIEKSRIQQKQTVNKRFNRQIKLLGEELQNRISQIKVGIVGVGGAGSHVAQQLAYLGVENFVLVDPDKVELSNLNRLIGASQKDVGFEKLRAISRHIKFINSKANVTVVAKFVYEEESISELKNVDFIFGCVDNDAARVVINNISTAYIIPYIDLGSDINLLPDGSIDSIGGRIFCVYPDGPCLLCAEGEIDQVEVANELSSLEDFEERVQRGYARGRIKRPAIVSINGMVASQAVTEFVFFFMEISRPTKFLYDVHGRLVKFLEIRKKSGCIHCTGYFGVGDIAKIKDYGRSKGSV